MHVHVHTDVLYVYCVCRYLQRPDEGIGSPGTEFQVVVKLPDVDTRKMNPHPLEEQQTFLITEPSLQFSCFLCCFSFGLG